MARADTITLLPIDDWARIMAIDPNHWNQVSNPAFPATAACPDIWQQWGWYDQASGRIIGREDVAQAILTAEEMIASTLGYFVSPRWLTGEEHIWPRPKRGNQRQYPPIETEYVRVLSGGVENSSAVLDDEGILYSDRDGDGVLDWATIQVTAAEMAAAGTTWDELAIYPPDETEELFRIRPLRITVDAAGDAWLSGWRSQFLDQALWFERPTLDLSVNANFLAAVDVRRRFNDTTQQSQLVYRNTTGCSSVPACGEVCQEACILIDQPRPGLVLSVPAAYAAGAWTYGSFLNGLPHATRLWYYSGYWRRINGWMEGDHMRADLAEAIVRLANCFLPAEVCGCGLTKNKFERDREEQEINNILASNAMSWFGTTCRGAIFAAGVIKRLGPLYRGGNL